MLEGVLEGVLEGAHRMPSCAACGPERCGISCLWCTALQADNAAPDAAQAAEAQKPVRRAGFSLSEGQPAPEKGSKVSRTNSRKSVDGQAAGGEEAYPRPTGWGPRALLHRLRCCLPLRRNAVAPEKAGAAAPQGKRKLKRNSNETTWIVLPFMVWSILVSGPSLSTFGCVKQCKHCWCDAHVQALQLPITKRQYLLPQTRPKACRALVCADPLPGVKCTACLPWPAVDCDMAHVNVHADHHHLRGRLRQAQRRGCNGGGAERVVLL